MIRTCIFIFANILRLPLWPFARLARLIRLRRISWITLRVPDRIAWTTRPVPLWQRWMRRQRPELSIFDLSRTIDSLSRDRRPRGLAVYVPMLRCGWAMADALEAELRRARQNGHEVRVILPDGAGPKELLVAGAAAQVAIGEGASLHFYGIALEKRYFGELLERVGVRFQVWRRSDYKCAADRLTRTKMSDEERQQLEGIANTLHARVLASLERSPAHARDALLKQGIVDASEACELGLVDHVLYDDQIQGWLADGGTAVQEAPASTYLRLRSNPYFRPLRRKPYIAVVEAYGAIRSERHGSAWGRPTGPVQRLRQAAKDKRALGVVLVVDSPGGSALTSDQIHREISRTMKHKPVVALFGNVAASGGYYIAACAEGIVAAPSTITGSIGVLSAKVVAEGLLHRLGVGTSIVKTAPSADVYSVARAASSEECTHLDRHLTHIYDRFLQVVAEGRGQPIADVEKVAGGRVWTGQDAIEHGLVDSLGGRPEVAQLLSPSLGRSPDEILRLPWRSMPGPKRALGAQTGDVASRFWSALDLTEGVWDALRDDPGPAYLAVGLPLFRQ